MKEPGSARSFLKPVAVMAFLLFTAVAANAQCNIDAETTLYNKFLENFKGSPDQQKAAVRA